MVTGGLASRIFFVHIIILPLLAIHISDSPACAKLISLISPPIRFIDIPEELSLNFEPNEKLVPNVKLISSFSFSETLINAILLISLVTVSFLYFINP